MAQRKYRIKSGQHVTRTSDGSIASVSGPGDIVTMDEKEAVPHMDKFEPYVAQAPAGVETAEVRASMADPAFATGDYSDNGELSAKHVDIVAPKKESK